MESKIPDWIGNLPFKPDKKEPVKIDSNDMGETAIYGEGKQRICCYTYISTDNILISHWIVPPGQSFQPPDIHSGDEPYYVLKGEAYVFNPETGQLVFAKEGDVIFIPRQTWHQVYNFSDKDVVIIAIIAGKPWVKKDMDLVAERGVKPVFYNE